MKRQCSRLDYDGDEDATEPSMTRVGRACGGGRCENMSRSARNDSFEEDQPSAAIVSKCR